MNEAVPSEDGRVERGGSSRRIPGLVGAAALVVGLAIGGAAGAAIGEAAASKELEEANSALRANVAEIGDLEDEMADLEAENERLQDAITEAEAGAEVSDPEPESTPSLGRFPDGYPVIVPVSELPDQVRNWYEMGSITEAVALAPGVWTELPPGADLESAIAAGVADGFCASVEAYERDYAGRDLAGTCW